MSGYLVRTALQRDRPFRFGLAAAGFGSSRLLHRLCHRVNPAEQDRMAGNIAHGGERELCPSMSAIWYRIKFAYSTERRFLVPA